MRNKPTIKNDKLFKLKQWVTIPEAARYLSIIWGENVSEADVLMFAADDRLALSINFVNCTVALQIMSTVSELEADIRAARNRPHIYFDKAIKFKDKVDIIEGVWDLLLLGRGPGIIKKSFHKLTNGPIVKDDYSTGIFLKGKNKQIVALQENRPMTLNDLNKTIKEGMDSYRDPPDYCLSDELPDDSILVIRTDALMDLQKHLSQRTLSGAKPIDNREERTYLNIIGALLEIVTGTFKENTFTSETQLREFISEKFDDLRGVRPRTLADKFALAKKALNGELD